MNAPLENHMLTDRKPAMPTIERDDEFQRFAAEECVTLPEHWHELQLSADQAGQMARIMGELDSACSGDSIAVNSILNALSHIQKGAINDILEGD